MQVTQPGGQPSNFGSDVTWWPNFNPICNKSENAYLNEVKLDYKKYRKSDVEKYQLNTNW